MWSEGGECEGGKSREEAEECVWQKRGVYSFKWGCREGLAGKVTLESGTGGGKGCVQHPGGEGHLLKPPLPCPGPSCLYVQLLHGNEMIWFLFFSHAILGGW